MGISSVNAPLRISNSPDASVAAFANVFSLSFASAPSGRGTVPTTVTASPPFAARSALTSTSAEPIFPAAATLAPLDPFE